MHRPFQLIPAIDLRGGRCVRLYQGDYAQETVYGRDPVAMARRWAELGAERLHVVDLDGAREGRPVQLDVAGAMARAVGIPVQLGGGLRDLNAIRAALEAGVERVVLGTAAIESHDLRRVALDHFGERIVIGLDTRDGKLAARGWTAATELDAIGFAERIAEEGAKRVVYTDIARDGTLEGPNLAGLRRMAEVPGLAVIASGGVGRLEDVLALAETGAEGAIVGKALYAGSLDFQAALRALAERAVGMGWSWC